MKLFYLFKFICLVCFVLGEEYNLYGDAGQAYSLEVYIGHPRQKLRLIVDTGSTTLAVASYPRRDHDKYFHAANSTTLLDSKKEVQAKYSQGNWVGRYVRDFIKVPSIRQVPELKSGFAIITKSHKFFMNGSGWQGLLGLAYSPVGAWGDHNIIVESWLDSVECSANRSLSFELTLCGVQSPTNATHYGKFSIIDDYPMNNCTSFRTPILHKRWYEVGVLAVNIRHANQTYLINETNNESSTLVIDDSILDMCEILNEQKSIVDSGTTNIRLPDEIYRRVIHQLQQASQSSNILILDEFWNDGEAACWPEPQDWLALPWLAIDLLSYDADDQYFTLEIPPQNYMRVLTASNNSGESGAVAQFCYKLGLEAGGADTVLGYTAMEGFEVVFNRSGSWVSFSPARCGPPARVSGPHTADYSLFSACQLSRTDTEVAVSIRAAQWALFAVSIIAAVVLVYLLGPCINTMIFKRRRDSQMTTSGEALVEQELC